MFPGPAEDEAGAGETGERPPLSLPAHVNCSGVFSGGAAGECVLCMGSVPGVLCLKLTHLLG